MPEFFKRLREDGTEAPTWWTRIGGKRVTTGQADLAAAKIWKRAEMRKAADPRLAASEGARIDDACNELIRELRRRGRSPATGKRALQKLTNVRDVFAEQGRHFLADIDARAVNEYIDARLTHYAGHKKTTVSRLTIRDELAFLRQVLKLARRHGTYALHPEDVLPLSFDTGHKPKKDWVRREDMETLLSHVEPRHAAHLLFFVCTGGRFADAYRSRREDWDLKKMRVLVRGSKTDGSYRTNPITPFLKPWATRLLRDAEGEDLLFTPWPNLLRDLKLACDRAGIPRVSTNGLRRTFGKWHRLEGYSLDDISKLFGHTTAKLVRDVYADVDGDELAEAMEASRKPRRYKNGTTKSESEQKLAEI